MASVEFFKHFLRLGMVIHAYNPSSTSEDEAGESSLRVAWATQPGPVILRTLVIPSHWSSGQRCLSN